MCESCSDSIEPRIKNNQGIVGVVGSRLYSLSET